MRRKPTLTCTALAGLLIIYGASADVERDLRIRQELRGAEIPSYLTFGARVAEFRTLQRLYPDIAWQIVNQEMHLDSESAARTFLARMVKASEELDDAQNKAYQALLCGQDSPRSRSEMTAALDTWDDVSEVVDHNAYTKFVTDLDDKQSRQFDAWLEDSKNGMVHIKLKHDQVFMPADDVVGYVDLSCAELRREE